MTQKDLWYCSKHGCYHEIGEWLECTVDTMPINKAVLIWNN